MAEPFDYAAFKELASELIEAAGESVTLRKCEETGRGRNKRKTHTTHTVRVVETNNEDGQGLTSTDGVNVGERDHSFIMSAAAGVVPETDDLIILNDAESTEVGIMKVIPLKPGGTTILYEIMGQV